MGSQESIAAYYQTTITTDEGNINGSTTSALNRGLHKVTSAVPC